MLTELKKLTDWGDIRVGTLLLYSGCPTRFRVYLGMDGGRPQGYFPPDEVTDDCPIHRLAAAPSMYHVIWMCGRKDGVDEP